MLNAIKRPVRRIIARITPDNAAELARAEFERDQRTKVEASRLQSLRTLGSRHVLHPEYDSRRHPAHQWTGGSLILANWLYGRPGATLRAKGV